MPDATYYDTVLRRIETDSDGPHTDDIMRLLIVVVIGDRGNIAKH